MIPSSSWVRQWHTTSPAHPTFGPGTSCPRWAWGLCSDRSCGRRRRRRRATTSYSTRRAAWSLLLLAIAVGFFAVAWNKWVSLAAAFVAGVAALRTGAVTQTQLVRHRPERTASVMVLWAIAWAGTKPIASFLDGYLASTIGIWCAVGALTSIAIVLALFEIFLPEAKKKSIRARARAAGTKLGKHIEAQESNIDIPLADAQRNFADAQPDIQGADGFRRSNRSSLTIPGAAGSRIRRVR